MPRVSRPKAKASDQANDSEKQATAGATGKAAKGRAAPKRKAEDDDPPKVDAAPAPNGTKKRKTKDEDAMPLAQRTTVATLAKGMHIGAHVSAAGGEQTCLSRLATLFHDMLTLSLKVSRMLSQTPFT